MPRNGAGVFSLVAGNPVVPATTIATSWANPTLDDIGDEITNSLDRNGKGAMLAPLALVSGTLLLPGLSFSAEPASGMYRESAGLIHLAVGATKVVTLQQTVVSLPLTSLDFPTAATRIKGDFSNATMASRVLFVDRVANNNTGVGAIPNGTGTVASLDVYGGSDPDNTHSVSLSAGPGETYIYSTKAGTGVLRPFSIYTGNVKRFTVDAAGVVGVGVVPGVWDTGGSTKAVQIGTTTAIADVGGSTDIFNNVRYAGADYRYLTTAAGSLVHQSGGVIYFYNTPSGTAGNAAVFTERMRLGADGQWLPGNGSATLPVYAFVNSPTTGIYRSGADEIAFSTNGAFRGKWQSSGGFVVGDIAGTDYVQLTTGSGVTVFTGGVAGLLQGNQLQLGNEQVVGLRNTGWSAMTGSADESTVYDTGTVTLPQLAGRVMALQAALTTHGLIGT